MFLTIFSKNSPTSKVGEDVTTTVEGVNNMCQIMEDFRDEITADVTKKVTEDVTKKNNSQTAVKLLEKKMGTFEDISEITGLSIDEIKELAEKINN